MAFKPTSKSQLTADSPEALFADIKSKQIPGLLAHQADVLREYKSFYENSKDLAAQLPTGSGKTLVALLIGEWRRITKGERVVYLCPTNQLVNQVKNQSNAKYGLNVIGFTGKKANYPIADKTQYISSQAIAITSYSALFNSNPFFEDPHLIILDDAHAAEQYVAQHWTMDINKNEDELLFNAVISVLQAHLSQSTIRRLTTPSESASDFHWIDKCPASKLFEMSLGLETAIEANITGGLIRPAVTFAWAAVKEHLNACNMFFSPGRIIVRPYLAPTFSHPPFQNAKQRLYLSATPGEGGELERVFCRRRIQRITPPKGSHRHGIGRRFFVFPELALSEQEMESLILKVPELGRVLVLVGNDPTSDKWKGLFRNKAKITVFSAADIEASKQPFISTFPSVAVLANRYDGIDFPGDECRQCILVDIPTATNPQEKFFITRLGASRAYDARMLTRIIQSFGRCTRSDTDFSLIIVIGDEFVSYLAKKDHQEFFHPELQGELMVGFDNSRDTTLNSTIENIREFLNQSKNWKDAETAIYSYRDQSQQAKLPGSDDLTKAVEYEVRFVEAQWNSDIRGALEQAKSVLGSLNDPVLRGYRALWSYFAGNMALRLSEVQHASEFYRLAVAASPSLSWLYETQLSEAKSSGGDITILEVSQLDGIEKFLLSVGIMHSREYDKREAVIREGMNSIDKFENAHRMLGEFLGFQTGKIEASGSPDPWWRLGDYSIWVFEDHAGAQPTSRLSVEKARQAATHENWIRKNLKPPVTTKITHVLISPVSKTEEGALCHLVNVKFWNLTDFRNWAEMVFATIRRVRASFTEPGDLEWRVLALEEIRTRKLTPELFLEHLKSGSDALTE